MSTTRVTPPSKEMRPLQNRKDLWAPCLYQALLSPPYHLLTGRDVPDRLWCQLNSKFSTLYYVILCIFFFHLAMDTSLLHQQPLEPPHEQRNIHRDTTCR